MANEQEFTKEEKAELSFVTSLAGIPLKAAGKPAIIVVGCKQGIHVNVIGNPDEILSEEINDGFKIAVGLLTTLDALTEDEQKQLCEMSGAAMKRKLEAREAAKAENPDSEPGSGEEAHHG